MSNTGQHGEHHDAAPHRDHHSRARRRRIPRLVVTGAVVVGVVGLVFTSRGSAPGAAAKTTRTARARSSATIMHVALSATETSRGGQVIRWSDDAWLGYPFGAGTRLGAPGSAGFRQILHHSGIGVQTGVFGRGLYSLTHYLQLPGDELYDPSRNTIYELKPVYYGPPFLKSASAGGCRDVDRGGFYAGTPATLSGGPEGWLRRVQADYLANGVYLGGPSARPFLSGFQSVIPDLWSPCVSEQVADQLHAGSAKLVGSGRVDGRRVIEYRATDGSWTYYADAQSHKPVRLVVRGIYGTQWPATGPPQSEQATLTLNVRSYEQLPFRGSQSLLSLTAQHPGARTDTKPANYYAAQARLFPTRRWG